jgi:hypothetical protein
MIKLFFSTKAPFHLELGAAPLEFDHQTYKR